MQDGLSRVRSVGTVKALEVRSAPTPASFDHQLVPTPRLSIAPSTDGILRTPLAYTYVYLFLFLSLVSREACHLRQSLWSRSRVFPARSRELTTCISRRRAVLWSWTRELQRLETKLAYRLSIFHANTLVSHDFPSTAPNGNYHIGAH